MNKTESSLHAASAEDREKLIQIQQLFDQAEVLLGGEPYIFYAFGINPPPENTKAGPRNRTFKGTGWSEKINSR